MTKRYNPVIEYEHSWDDYVPVAEMEVHKNGKYVRFESHKVTAAEVTNLIKKNVKLRKEIDELKEQIEVLKSSKLN